MPDSESRWSSLWYRLEASGDPQAEYRDLARRYAEPHRKYHTLDHVLFCLTELDSVRHLAAQSDALELAIWFHDSIFDLLGRENEERSAALAVEFVRRAGLPAGWSDLVSGLILATKHTQALTDPDEQLIADIDLCGFGHSQEALELSEKLVRTEFETIPDLVYIPDRIAILQRFLSRPTIYFTPYYQEECEAQARSNIERSLARLQNA